MKKFNYKVTAILVSEKSGTEVMTSIQTNTSMVGAIKDVEKIAERSGVKKVRVIKCIDLEF